LDQQELIPHLFRTEYRKIVSVLCKRFGFGQVETAEDIASETFITAAQTWALKGLPPSPVAWLYNVAKNKARNQLYREAVFESKIAPAVKGNINETEAFEIDLSERNINDSQLQMIFAVCHPSIPVESQIGLSLRILCGFGIDEIAEAFLSNKETINKRLFRAREKLREGNISIEMPTSAEINERLDAVLTTIYLLFSEGYYSASRDQTIRKELCLEAMRLCYMLIENKSTNKPRVNALMSLMCFHTSRLDARLSETGELILYDDQDTALWNADLIGKGGYYLKQAATGDVLSKYHLEAGIAYWNTQQADTEEKWDNILQLYNHLLRLEYSPVAALNRTYALSKANGKLEAIEVAEKLKLTGNHFYYALLGDLYTGINNQKAKMNFENALAIIKTVPERLAIEKKICAL